MTLTHRHLTLASGGFGASLETCQCPVEYRGTWLRPLPALFLLFILAGCGSRDRSNPFDPKNPDTGGVLPGLRVVAGDHRADISWDLQAFGPGPKVRIERASLRDTNDLAIAEVPLESAAFADTLLAKAGTYTYRVRVIAASGAGGVATVDTVTPDVDQPWVVDSGHERLLQLSPDNRSIRFESDNFGTPEDVVFDRGSQVLWMANTFDGTVVKLDPSGRPLAAYPGVDFPSVLAVDELRAALWVGDDRSGAVMKMALDGSEICRAKGFAGVASLAVDPQDGGVWVAEQEAGRVTKVRSNGTRQVTLRGFVSPRRVQFDPGLPPVREPALWIADFSTGQLAKATPEGREIFRLVGYPGISALHLERYDIGGNLFVGVTAAAGAGMVLVLDSSGRELRRFAGPENPVSFSQNMIRGAGPSPSNSCPATIWVADAAGGAVWKISCGGTTLRRQGGLSAPQAIVCTMPRPPYTVPDAPARP